MNDDERWLFYVHAHPEIDRRDIQCEQRQRARRWSETAERYGIADLEAIWADGIARALAAIRRVGPQSLIISRHKSRTRSTPAPACLQSV